MTVTAILAQAFRDLREFDMGGSGKRSQSKVEEARQRNKKKDIEGIKEKKSKQNDVRQGDGVARTTPAEPSTVQPLPGLETQI